MRRILSITCLSLLFPFLLSCEKEDIRPNDPSVTQTKDASTSKVCNSFSYTAKDGSITDLGTAIGDIIYVSFAPTTSPEAKQRILALYPEISHIGGEFSTTSRMITDVRLTPGIPCTKALQIIRSLKEKKEVDFALPVFDRGIDENNVRQWSGLTDEILVLVDGPESVADFKRLVGITKTTLVNPESEDFFILSVDKYAKGTVLQMTTLLNQQPYVIGAEPSLTVQSLSFL